MSQLTDNLYSIDAIKSGIRSAIEEKGVDMTGYSFPDYPAAIANISGGVSGYTTKSVAERNYFVSTFIDSTITCVADYAYLGVSKSYFGYRIGDYDPVPIQPYIQEVQLDNCLYVNTGAFMSNYQLDSVYLKTCVLIQSSAFQFCSLLSHVKLDNCYDIGNNAFESCGKNIGVFELDLTNCSHFCSLYGINTLPSYASVFVPSSLFSDYDNDQVWTNFTIISV